MEQETHYASPERSSLQDINEANKLLATDISFLNILGAVSGITAILDENRQIVYANNELLDLLGISSIESVLGKRPGEAVSCIHSGENKYGCGTSEACKVCGAVNSILESQRSGQKSTRETRITSFEGENLLSWDLKVTSSPIKIKDHVFYFLTIQDISNEKKRENLEKIFFHDILNSAGGLNGLLQLLKDGVDPGQEREIINLSEEASRDIIEEISLHRQLRAAENGDLTVDIQLIDSLELLKSAVGKIEHHNVAIGKKIIIDDNSTGDYIATDTIIMHRVLINLLKNALESTEKGGTVFAGVLNFDDKVRFYVKNDMVIPNEVSLQIFQRSFTTKGIGRGVGTYSIKLLTENYLKGKVDFTSLKSEGTIFFVDLFKSKNLKSNNHESTR
jgi:nitrogen-specific signal transduction histidine kinase